MGDLRTILRENLTGAWQVMLGRPDGLSRLDTSLEGFWRSFAAVILVVPFAVLAVSSDAMLSAAEGLDVPPMTGRTFTLQGIAILCDWFAFPLVFAIIAPPFGLSSRYVPFIVTRNWAAVIIGAMVGVIPALHIVGIIPTALVPVFLLIAIAVALRFSYVVARITLAVSMGMALPIVLLELLLSLTIWSIFDGFI